MALGLLWLKVVFLIIPLDDTWDMAPPTSAMLPLNKQFVTVTLVTPEPNIAPPPPEPDKELF
jgi:hypothetical protein